MFSSSDHLSPALLKACIMSCLSDRSSSWHLIANSSCVTVA